MQQYESLPMAQWDLSGGSERRTGLGDSDWRPNNRSNAKLIIHDGVMRHTAEIRYSQDSGTINIQIILLIKYNGYICMHKRHHGTYRTAYSTSLLRHIFPTSDSRRCAVSRD